MSTTIFITGATGYIGGSVLTALLDNKSYKITALVRSEDKAKKLKDLGVEPLIGTLDSANLITKAAKEHDVTIEVADCDHLGEAQAIIAGLKQKLQETGKKGIYIQTSGTGILSDTANGQFVSDKIYSDADTASLTALPESQPHRHVDTVLVQEASDYTLAMITPPCIYGEGTGAFNRRSIQIPLVIRSAIERRNTPQVGDGKNVWSNVHIKDLVPVYTTLLSKLLSNDSEVMKNTGEAGYWFAETGQHNWGEISQFVAKKLHALGAVDDEKVYPKHTEQEVIDGFGFKEAMYFTGGNSRCVAEKTRKVLGWKPELDSEDEVWKYVEWECKKMFKEHQEKKQ
ncbi:hypothetical protein YB2330_003882 [Saitoella coloradoensis]